MSWKVRAVLVAVMACAAAEVTDTQREAQRQVAEANNAFSADLYGKLSSQPGNLILSPLSASTVLALVLQGAGGQTAQQLQAALHLPADAAVQRDGFKAFTEQLRQRNEEVTVRVANKVFAQRGASVKAPFRSVAVGSFGADAEELDFAGATEAARQRINAWVEDATDAKIKDLLDSLDPATLMVLVNAVYFKGTWATPFHEGQTRNETFHVSRSEHVSVPMMHRTARFGHAALPDLGARVLVLPYSGHTMRMLVVLPDEVDGLPRVEAGLRSLDLARLSRDLTHGEVVVSLPKFKIESKFNLEETLPQLGINDLFTPAANLSGITDVPVQVSKVVQKAFVEVTEKGTVAAAATAVVVVPYSSFKSNTPPVIFNADRPFVYFIIGEGNTIFFVGRAQNPLI